MFRFLRKKARSPTNDAEALECEFNSVMEQLSHAPAAKRAEVAYGVALFWQMFNAEFGSADSFLKQPRTVQLAYGKKLSTLPHCHRD